MNFREWVAGKKYYHGSFTKLPVGTILRPSPEYEQNWGKTNFYKILEKYRPANMISHKNAVFMVADLEDVDLAGGADAFIYEVKPLGTVQQHDINWSSEIDLLMDSDEIDENALKKAAMHYWRGDPHYNESVYEYLTTSAVIIALIEEN
jgi:hypothetical protein